MPTSKPTKIRERFNDLFNETEDEIYQGDKGLLRIYSHKGLPVLGRRIAGRIVKHPEQKKRAIEYINELKES